MSAPAPTEPAPFVLRAARPSDRGAIRALVRAARLDPRDLHHAALVVAALGPAVIGAVRLRDHPARSTRL